MDNPISKKELRTLVTDIESKIKSGYWKNIILHSVEMFGEGNAFVFYIDGCSISFTLELGPTGGKTFFCGGIDNSFETLLNEHRESLEGENGHLSYDEAMSWTSAFLDVLNTSKISLTGSDYEHYELNSDIVIDKYGGMYNVRSKTFLKFIKPDDIVEYWMPEGIKKVNLGSLRNLKNLHTLVLPESLEYLHPNDFSNCPELSRIVVKGQCDIHNNLLELDHEYIAYLPENYECDLCIDHRYLSYYDPKLLKEGIIASKPNMTFRQLRDELNKLTEDELDTEIRLSSPYSHISDMAINLNIPRLRNLDDSLEGSLEKAHPNHGKRLITLLKDKQKQKEAERQYKTRPENSSYLMFNGKPFVILCSNLDIDNE